MAHRIRRIAWFETAMGGIVVAWWIFAMTTNQVPEVEEGRAIWFHLTAEALMAGSLVAGGWLLLRGRTSAGVGISALGLGSAFYSLVNAAGYYVDSGEPILSGVFLVVAAITALVAVGLLEPMLVGKADRSERRGLDVDAVVGG